MKASSEWNGKDLLIQDFFIDAQQMKRQPPDSRWNLDGEIKICLDGQVFTCSDEFGDWLILWQWDRVEDGFIFWRHTHKIDPNDVVYDMYVSEGSVRYGVTYEEMLK